MLDSKLAMGEDCFYLAIKKDGSAELYVDSDFKKGDDLVVAIKMTRDKLRYLGNTIIGFVDMHPPITSN